ncbi:MAG: hypothetical protein PHE12_04805, partial [Clostridia bacterium]|nr:hypothetical protein [Clostridia bacterium]
MLIDFNSLADTDALVAACAEGLTQSKTLLSLSNDGGYNNSKAVKIAANETSDAADIYLKRPWGFAFDYIEFYYNVPSGSANFFLRLYLDVEGSNEYKQRAYVSFTAEDIKLSGSGFIRLPVSSEYLQGGGDATAEQINTLNVKGLGLYVNSGSAEFYIDNIKLYRESALPAQQDKIQAASVRNIINGLEDGDYNLVVQRSYSVGGHKTLYPAVNVNFNVKSNVSDIAAADFEDKITDGNKYIYTIYKQGIIVCRGRLEPTNSLLINFEDYEDIDDLAAACAEGITNSNSAMSISQTGGFNDSTALKISNTGDLYLKKLWDFPDFDYFEFYYNVPSGEAAFYLRFYLDTASGYSHRAYVDFTNSGLKLSGSGIIRVPISSTYLAVNGTDASNIISAKIKGLGIYVSGGEFYIDNIKLYKESALPTAQNTTEEAAIRTIIDGMAQGSGYRLVVEKSYIVSSPHKALKPVINAEFDVTEIGVTTLEAADFEDILPDTAANYIYTIYSAEGAILHFGTLIIS